MSIAKRTDGGASCTTCAVSLSDDCGVGALERQRILAMMVEVAGRGEASTAMALHALVLGTPCHDMKVVHQKHL